MFRFLCILDFEATCDRDKSFTPSHEIIEFPSVLLELVDGRYQVVSEFQEFCRPIYNIKLTPFCKELTGITQEQVSKGADFPDVLKRHQAWLDQYTNLNLEDTMIVTCGRWDLVEMLPEESRRWLTKPHQIYHRVINIKDAFLHQYGPFRGGMAPMLTYMGIELLGRHHSGIDDCRNIARMAIELADAIHQAPNIVIQVDPKVYNLSKEDRAKLKTNLERQLQKRGK